MSLMRGLGIRPDACSGVKTCPLQLRPSHASWNDRMQMTCEVSAMQTQRILVPGVIGQVLSPLR